VGWSDEKIRAEYDRRYSQPGREPTGCDGAQLLLQFARAPGRVLDLGSGDGSGALLLLEAGFAVEGVDFSPVGVEAARIAAAEFGAAATFHLADVRTFDLRERRFDHVLISNILHFVGEGGTLLTTCQECVGPGGIHIVRGLVNEPSSGEGPAEIAAVYAGWESLIFTVERREERARGAACLTAVFRKRGL
jgi:2-polyprenyl-3-methyl-5-hydroxy-6-metoxy-1,4-benzoquinol methylase